MSNFTLKREGFSSYTSIPDIFIEKYMPKAAGEFVKIYIYLLKCLEENREELSISRIADAFDDTHKDVIRALKYWQRNGLLKLTFEGDTLTALSLSSPFEHQDSEAADESETASAHGNIVSTVSDHVPPSAGKISDQKPAEHEKHEYSRAEIAEFSADGETPLLIFGIQKYLGRTLTSADLNSIMFFRNDLGFSDELIEYLFEYCVSNHHKSMRYIEKTAVGWADEGISSVGAAKAKRAIYSSSTYPIMNALGLGGRKPSKTEISYIDKWILSYGFDLNIVLEACKRTIDTIHQPSFEYTDSILKRWRAADAYTPEQIKVLDAEHIKKASEKKSSSGNAASGKSAAGASSNKFVNFDQRKYDYDELEKQFFNK